MIALIAALAFQGAGQDRKVEGIELTRDPKRGPTAFLSIETQELDPMRRSPKKFGTPPVQWEFPWLARGYVRVDTNFRLKFRVYSQDRKEKNDPGARVTRMLTALWDLGQQRIKLDHPEQYNGGIVDVYLCWGGKAGGEQRFDVAREGNDLKHVNTIYFYDLASFTDPVETAREVAHEYGHAVLPAIGGYSAPEDWANGYLGERLFLMYARDGLTAGTLSTDDTMGATADQIGRWVTKNVDPLVEVASQSLPTPAYLADRTATGMERYLGLALYSATILPDSVFARSLRLTGSTRANDYPEAIALAAEEPESFDLRLSPALRTHPLWVPINKGTITGAKILRYLGKWAKIQPTGSTVTITNRRQ